jgi:mono/diheme cytochrome c family protein
LRLAGLAVGSTLFYAWVGQLVPQKEVQPPVVVEMSQDLTTEDLVEIGREIFEGKGICATCHTIGRSGALRFPDLDGIALRAGTRVPGLGALEYMAQSLYEPEAYIVPGFAGGMPTIDKPPIGLSEDEIKAVISYLQTLGGEPTITMATVLPYSQGADATSDVDPPGPGDAPPAGEAEDAGPAAELPAGAPADAGNLLGRYGCLECHSTAPGAELTLAGLGAAPSGILIGITDHRPPLDGTAAGRMTLAEVRTLADYLTGLEGER